MPSPAAKDTLLQAVIALYETITPTMPTIVLDQQPEDASQTPAAVLIHGGETPEEWDTATNKPTTIRGRFTIELYYNSLTTLETKAGLVKSAFTPIALVLTDPQSAVCFRSDYVVKDSKLRDQSGNRVYVASIPFEVLIAKPAN